MSTLAEHIIVAGAENPPPILKKSMYDSWTSCIRLFLKGKKHGRMMLDSIDNGPLVYLTIEENGKFVTDVKLAKSLYTTNYDQLYAYLSQHERHANEVCISRERYPDPLAFVANSPILYNPSQSPQHSDSSLAVPMFQQGEDPIECINKVMAFLSVVASRFPPPNNQLRTLSNPRNQATIQDGNKGIATTSKGNVIAGQPRVVKCYRCQGEGHMARQCTQPKRPRNAAWFKDKLMLAEAQEVAFQTEDLDAYDSYCDDLSSAKAVLMANLLSCDPEVLFRYSEQTHVDDFKDNDIHSGSNIIPYSQYLQESQDAVIQDTNPSTPNDLLVLSLVEQMTDHVTHLDKENQKNKIVNESLTTELEKYKERIAIFKQRLNVDLNKREKLIDSQMDDLIRDRNKKSKYIDKEIVLEKQNKELENIICKMYRSTQAMHMLTKPQVFYDDTHKQALGYQNPFHLKKAQRIQPTLYDGSVIAKEHAVISMIDDEESLILKEESRSKMLDKQNDPISIENKIKISLIDYSKLNKIKEDFGKRFFTKKELSTEQAFWLKHSSLSETPITSHTPVRIEAPIKLSKSQEKDTVIRKLKDRIKSLSGKDSVENVKKDIDEIETINIELEHSVAKLHSENENLRKEQEHLKSIYKDQFDSIKKTRVQFNEHHDSLIAQINAKSVENSDLNAQLQEKGFAITTLKNKLRKLKGKNIVNTAVSIPNASISLRMFKLDTEPIL
ncbi:copia protein [Tanacetum coccineum]